jgi:phage terminase Nu1 subunit (DNA packaging protein)
VEINNSRFENCRGEHHSVTQATIDDMTVGLAELGRICSMAPSTVREYVREGVFVQRPKGRYPLIRCVSKYIEKIREQASGRGAARDPSRAELAKAQAAIARAKAGVLSGKLVDVKEMEAETLAEWRKLRGLILAIPTRVANQAVGLKRSDLVLIEKEIDAVLNEMADAIYTSPVPFESGMEESAPAAKAPAAKRLGRRKHKAPLRRQRTARPG